MNVIGAAGQRAALEPFFALVRHAITVGVRELPDARRTGDVNRTVIPKATLREHYFIGEHDRLVEASVAVRVFQTHDTVGRVRQLLVRFLVRA